MTTVPMIPTQISSQTLALIQSGQGSGGSKPALPLVPTVEILKAPPAAGTKVWQFNGKQHLIKEPLFLPEGTTFFRDASGKIFINDVTRPFQNPYAEYAADSLLSEYFSRPGKDVIKGFQDSFTKQDYQQWREYNADLRNGRPGGPWLEQYRLLNEKLERTIAPGSGTPANPNVTTLDPTLTIAGIATDLASAFGFDLLENGLFNPINFTKKIIERYTKPTPVVVTPPTTDYWQISANASAIAAENSARTTYLNSTVGVFSSQTDAVNYTLNFNRQSKSADDIAIVLKLRREFNGANGSGVGDVTTVYVNDATKVRQFFDEMVRQGRYILRNGFSADQEFAEVLNASGIAGSYAGRLKLQSDLKYQADARSFVIGGKGSTAVLDEASYEVAKNVIRSNNAGSLKNGNTNRFDVVIPGADGRGVYVQDITLSQVASYINNILSTSLVREGVDADSIIAANGLSSLLEVISGRVVQKATPTTPNPEVDLLSQARTYTEQQIAAAKEKVRRALERLNEGVIFTGEGQRQREREAEELLDGDTLAKMLYDAERARLRTPVGSGSGTSSTSSSGGGGAPVRFTTRINMPDELPDQSKYKTTFYNVNWANVFGPTQSTFDPYDVSNVDWSQVTYTNATALDFKPTGTFSAPTPESNSPIPLMSLFNLKPIPGYEKSVYAIEWDVDGIPELTPVLRPREYRGTGPLYQFGPTGSLEYYDSEKLKDFDPIEELLKIPGTSSALEFRPGLQVNATGAGFGINIKGWGSSMANPADEKAIFSNLFDMVSLNKEINARTRAGESAADLADTINAFNASKTAFLDALNRSFGARTTISTPGQTDLAKMLSGIDNRVISRLAGNGDYIEINKNQLGIKKDSAGKLYIDAVKVLDINGVDTGLVRLNSNVDITVGEGQGLSTSDIKSLFSLFGIDATKIQGLADIVSLNGGISRSREAGRVLRAGELFDAGFINSINEGLNDPTLQEVWNDVNKGRTLPDGTPVERIVANIRFAAPRGNILAGLKGFSQKPLPENFTNGLFDTLIDDAARYNATSFFTFSAGLAVTPPLKLLGSIVPQNIQDYWGEAVKQISTRLPWMKGIASILSGDFSLSAGLAFQIVRRTAYKTDIGAKTPEQLIQESFAQLPNGQLLQIASLSGTGSATSGGGGRESDADGGCRSRWFDRRGSNITRSQWTDLFGFGVFAESLERRNKSLTGRCEFYCGLPIRFF